MKTLSLARPLILMVIGLPGAGKSFFANQFSDTFSVASVSADRLRYELFATPQFTADENEIVNRLQNYMATELAKSGRSFLIDGGCDTKAARQKVVQLAKDNGYGTLVIWVQTDPATAKSRSLKRSATKADDQYNTSLSDAQFEALAQRFVQPTKEDNVVISGKYVYGTQARTVLRKLAAPRTEAISKDEPVAVAPRSTPQAIDTTRRNVVIR